MLALSQRFPAEVPDAVPDGADFTAGLNPASLEVRTGCKLEPALAGAAVGVAVQFERLGYFTPDPDSTPDHLVFNRTLTLRDTWAKVQARDRVEVRGGAG